MVTLLAMLSIKGWAVARAVMCWATYATGHGRKESVVVSFGMDSINGCEYCCGESHEFLPAFLLLMAVFHSSHMAFGFFK